MEVRHQAERGALCLTPGIFRFRTGVVRCSRGHGRFKSDVQDSPESCDIVYDERLDVRVSGVELEALDDLCRVWQASRSAVLRTLIVATWWQQWGEQEPGTPSFAEVLAVAEAPHEEPRDATPRQGSQGSRLA